MNGFYNPYLMGLPYSSPIPSMYEDKTVGRPIPQEGNGLMKGLGIAGTAMQTAAPMAQMLLSRQRPRPQMSSSVVAGSRGSPFLASNPYQVGGQQPEQRQSMLIRYLLGRQYAK